MALGGAVKSEKTWITGHVDGHHSGCIYGWALDQNSPARPVIVTLSVNDDPVADVLAAQDRRDVATAFGTSGVHGFRVRIPERYAGLPIRINVTAEGMVLPGSPWNGSVTPAAPETSSSARCLLFMHIQKTAGTSFREAILCNYDLADVLLLYPDPPGVPEEAIHLVPQSHLDGLQLIMGHFVYGVHARLTQDSSYVTMLRNPVDRVISNYHHMVRFRTPYAYRDGRFLSLEEVLEERTSVEMDNLLTRSISGINNEVGTVNRDVLTAAIHNLEQHFELVGHQENALDFWQAMSSRYGWQHGALARVNEGAYRKRPIPFRLRRLIEEANRFDCELYDYVLENYRRAC